MNKFDLINKVLVSDLDPKNKPLLIELIVRANEDWQCWPSIERLCKVRGISHERNFKGVDAYLPGLVTKTKRGRSYLYTINTSAVAELSEADVTIKHTNFPSNTSATEEVNTSAPAENTSAAEGANTTSNTTSNTTRDTTEAPVSADASTVSSNYKYKTVSNPPNSRSTETVYMIDLSGVTKTVQDRNTSAVEEVSQATRILTPGEQRLFEKQVRIHRLDTDKAAVALELVKKTHPRLNIEEAITQSLRAVGVHIEEEVW